MLLVERTIPYGSQILVSKGQSITFDDSIATQTRTGELVRVLIADQLKVSPEKIIKYLTVSVGQKISSGDLLASFSAFWGLANQKIYSFCDGIVERVVLDDGSIEIRTDPEVIQTKSFICGTVEIITLHKVSVDIDGFVVAGTVGFGPEVVAIASCFNTLQSQDKKVILIAKNNEELQEVLSNDQLIGKVAGVVIFQICNQLTKQIASSKNPLVESSDQLPFSLVVLDRFGTESMPDETYQKLLNTSNKHITLFPKTQIRAGGVRPYIVVS
jgi:hypothetical protein